MGKHREQYVLEAQSKTKNAHQASMAAALNLFRSELEEDQQAYEAMKMRQDQNSFGRSDPASQPKPVTLEKRHPSACHCIPLLTALLQGLQRRLEEAAGYPCKAGRVAPCLQTGISSSYDTA